MKKARYKTTAGEIEVEYDEKSPCIICGLPVEAASTAGTDVCPWCDMGRHRNGSRFTIEEVLNKELLREKAKKIYEKIKGGDNVKD